MRPIFVGLEAPIPLEKLKTWLKTAVEQHNILRLKGIIHIKDGEQTVPYVVQGVGNVLDIHPARKAEAAPGNSKMVLFGYHLPKSELQNSFSALL